MQVTPKIMMPDMANRIAALKQQVETAGEIWQPAPGDSLVGVFIGHQKVADLYGENYQILIQYETNAVMVVWVNQWLSNNLNTQKAELGDLIALKFLGQKKSAAGRSYNAYNLIISKA